MNLKPFPNYMRAATLGLALVFASAASAAAPGPAVGEEAGAAMQGIPPVKASQVTMANYLKRPYSQWAFRNSGAPLNVVMIPREGDISSFAEPSRPNLGRKQFDDWHGKRASLARIFEDNYADGLVVVRGEKLLYERYFGDFNPHAQHLWFSMTKSLVSAAFGLLVEQDRVDLSASPAQYIPELRGSGFERVTIQQVLDHATAINFKENYTDPTSDFFRFYAPALNMMWLPGAADVQPDAEIYGVHDFLARFVKPDSNTTPGEAFDYNSSNADVLGWLLARISGQPLQDYLQQHIWSKIGAEHDAYIAVDRAFMPVATGGMNTTARDAARFGMLIRDRGFFEGKRVLPQAWMDDIVAIDARNEANMANNAKYAADPWQAYHNMWWVLDAEAGEFCAVGVHGQVIYINRKADTVMSWFSSQPDASAAGNPHFHVKLAAARELARQLRD
jgi:CubicO group peptidase (beta-lactamase class C family)